MSPWAQLAITAQATARRESRTPPVKNVGKPCAGEPQARFDGRDWKRSAGHGRSESCRGETLDRSAKTYSRTHAPASVPDPPSS
jgi:hypothetical protein